MNNLVPIKVKIGLRPNGHADHPPFNKLPADVRGGVDWATYITSLGVAGWYYDKVSGHKECDLNNEEVPDGHEHRNDELGCQYGCLLVPEAFAVSAIAQFGGAPYFIKIIDEASFELFYDDRAHAHEEDEIVDLDALQKIQARISAGDDTPATKALLDEARDPSHPRRGVRKNHRKRWADNKKRRGITIRADLAKPSA